MDCRETQTLLTAFHDGELPADGQGWPSAGAGRDAPGFGASAADRARVEEHLRGCPECGAMLADLARADQSAGVPDPGPAYWDRFNARVMDRVERKADGHGWPSAEAGRGATGSIASADGQGVAVLRPKHGWIRQQLRYLVPAAAAAALVVVIVRYGGMNPVAPRPTAMDGLVPGQAGMPRDLSPRPAIPPAVSEPAVPDPAGQRMDKAESTAVKRRVPPTAMDGLVPGQAGMPRDLSPRPTAHANERFATVTREERDRPADGQGRPSAGTGRDAAGSVVPAGSPCERARTLAAQERWREAEYAHRACLAGNLDESSREKGLVFLAELLDRQARFAEADAVITEVDRRFPQSRPLDLYRQQRPMVQKQPAAVPVTR